MLSNYMGQTHEQHSSTSRNELLSLQLQNRNKSHEDCLVSEEITYHIYQFYWCLFTQ